MYSEVLVIMFKSLKTLMVRKMNKLKIITYLLVFLFTVSISTTGIFANKTNSCWEEVYPPTDPGSKRACFLGYDIESDVTLTFDFEEDTLIGEDRLVHVYDANENTWSEKSTDMPDHIFNAGVRFAYHEMLDALIFFGGATSETSLFLISNQTWAYFYNNNSWINLNPSNPPPARIWNNIAYDSYYKKIVIFNGLDVWSLGGKIYNDVWFYDYLTNSWTNITTDGGPEPVYAAGCVYDSDSKKILMFGGATDCIFGSYISGYSNKLWEFDLSIATWSERSPSGYIPEERGYIFLTYDSNAKKTVFFGGTSKHYDGSAEGQYFNCTFIYDYSNNKWMKLNCSVGPSARYLAGLAYNSKLDHILQYGGGQGNYGLNPETWIFTYDERCDCFLDNVDYSFLAFTAVLLLLGNLILIVRRRKKTIN